MKSEDPADGQDGEGTEVAVAAAGEVMNKELVYRQVHYWLKDNQELMSRYEPEADYTSDLMSVSTQ